MPRLQVETTYGAAKREAYKQLRAFNARAAGKMVFKPVAITLREGGKVVGMLTGETYWSWFAIEALWIAEAYRGKGLGKALLEKAEGEARKHGAQHAFVNSFSFQAPGFYQKLGYREFGRLDGFPAGHSCSWLTKAL
jgi:GNAT superfamily N-acetyltransferase